jgi:predicted dithiol-disulfide oxidoreductase (DUF899 family)
LSAFLRVEGQVLHAYSTHARGLDLFMNTENLLDHTPLGRQEDGPGTGPTGWIRHHDRY